MQLRDNIKKGTDDTRNNVSRVQLAPPRAVVPSTFYLNNCIKKRKEKKRKETGLRVCEWEHHASNRGKLDLI